MNNKKYWLRWGITLLVIGLIVSFIRFVVFQIGGIGLMVGPLNYLFTMLSFPGMLLANIVPGSILHGFTMSQEIVIIILNSLSYLVVGILFGIIYEKITLK